MGIIISVKDTRVDRIFTNPVTKKEYLKIFNFKAGVALKTDNAIEEDYAQALANTYPKNYFLDKNAYEKYIKALAESPETEGAIEVIEAEAETPEVLEEPKGEVFPTPEQLSSMSHKDLKAIATELGIEFSGNISKDALVALISEQINEVPKEG